MNIAITTEVQDAEVRGALLHLKEQANEMHGYLDKRRQHMPVGSDRTAAAGWVDVLDELRAALAVALGETENKG